MIDYDYSTPTSYASHLAKYISDPSTIRARTLDQFGSAPPVSAIREMRAKLTKPVNRIGIHTGRFRCGHPRTHENTVWLANDNDVCLQCRGEKQREEFERRKVIEAQREAEKARKLREAELQIKAANVRRVGARPPVTDELLVDVAQAYMLTVADLLGPSRLPLIVRARSVVARVLAEGGMSKPNIARRLNKACHSTIIHMLNTWDARAKYNPDMLEVYMRVR